MYHWESHKKVSIKCTVHSLKKSYSPKCTVSIKCTVWIWLIYFLNIQCKNLMNFPSLNMKFHNCDHTKPYFSIYQLSPHFLYLKVSFFIQRSYRTTIFWFMTDKRTVSIKCTVSSFLKRFLLSVPYNQKFGGLNCLRTGTLNRKHRVTYVYFYAFH